MNAGVWRYTVVRGARRPVRDACKQSAHFGCKVQLEESNCEQHGALTAVGLLPAQAVNAGDGENA